MSGTTTRAAPAWTAAGGPSLPVLAVHRLGTVGYGEALALQSELVRARRAGSIPDTLVLLEHPHVITLGSASDPAHVLAGDAERARRGIELFEAGRGGDVTYHGPGQLVGYPIVALEEARRDLHRYLRDLEDGLIDALTDLGVPAGRRPGLTGVWTVRGKIAAIGVRVSSGWITSHGFALNVSTDLAFFDTIVPCGIMDCVVTSVERELGSPVTVAGVQDAVAAAVAGRLGRVLA
jgi:lipoyl(octanoyl) transferase